MIQKSATIQDVARRAKVSTATISRVLSKFGPASEKTRNEVLEAIKLTGYPVNQAARNFRGAAVRLPFLIYERINPMKNLVQSGNAIALTAPYVFASRF